MRKINLKPGLILFIMLVVTGTITYARPPKKDIYLLHIYRLKSAEQLQKTEAFLKKAYLPGLHKTGIRNIGVFIPIANDTAAVKSIYVLIPLSSEKDILQLDEKLRKNDEYLKASKEFREAPSTDPPYDRMESMIMEAFNGQKHLMVQTKKEGRIFELRSYESPTEKLHDKKVAMFENEEIKLFKKLDFNVVFYARVLAGGRKPNFIYMPSFETIEARNAHWKTFGEDPEWKAMSSDPVNENKVSVSRIESILMKAAEYSDL